MSRISTKSYESSDKETILKRARSLIGRSLRDFPPDDNLEKIRSGGKGDFGNLLERRIFKIVPNNRPEPDFLSASIELKTSPVIEKRDGVLGAKERMVLGMINYEQVIEEEFASSSFLNKNALMLLIFYLYERGKDILDLMIKLADLWQFPKEDLKIIEDDWNKIVGMIKVGKADELSERQTIYLGACTKSSTSKVRRKQPKSDIGAKPRAFALKQKYVNYIIQTLLKRQGEQAQERIVKNIGAYHKGETFEEHVMKKFEKYYGMTPEQIAKETMVGVDPKAKNFYSCLTAAVLGVKGKKFAEFERGDIIVRTIRLEKNGIPKEHISLPAFKFNKIVNETWQTSTFKEQLDKRYFFVIFKRSTTEQLILHKVAFWAMPIGDIRKAREVWLLAVGCVRSGHFESLPKIKESEICHVRPHGKNKQDMDLGPTGIFWTKQCFWLKNTYIANQLDESQ